MNRRNLSLALALVALAAGVGSGASVRFPDCGPISRANDRLTQSGTGGRTLTWVGDLTCGLGDDCCFCVDMYIFNASVVYPFPANPVRHAGACWSEAQPSNTSTQALTVPSTYHGTFSARVDIYPCDSFFNCNLNGTPLTYSKTVTFP